MVDLPGRSSYIMVDQGSRFYAAISARVKMTLLVADLLAHAGARRREGKEERTIKKDCQGLQVFPICLDAKSRC